MNAFGTAAGMIPVTSLLRRSWVSFHRSGSQEGDMAGNSTEPGQSVTSRIAAILLAFTDCDVHSLTEIARLTRLPVSTAHRLAVELAATDFLERDESGRYRVAPSLRQLGATAWRTPTLAERGPFVLNDLSAVTLRTARLGVLSGTVVNYIEKRPHQPVTSFDSAATLPAHATAVGKALLAFSPTRIADRLIMKGLPEFTRNTITAPDQLRHNLASIRRAGFAVSVGELEIGTNAIAMPVFSDRKAIAVLELRVRDPRHELATVTAALAMACGSLSRELRDGIQLEQSHDRLVQTIPYAASHPVRGIEDSRRSAVAVAVTPD
jgi:IclR family transcriptional regulator, acetate operon repressor